MTGLDPDLRLHKHKAAIEANQVVLKHSLRLLPARYEVYNVTVNQPEFLPTETPRASPSAAAARRSAASTAAA